MTSDKSDVAYPSPKKAKFEQLRADHELFLRTFEKPTQIYRFLRTRNAVAPVFLHRTLTYMRERRARPPRKHKDFKIDDMLSKVENRTNKDEATDVREGSGFLNLSFTAFFHGTGPVNGDVSNKNGTLVKEDLVSVDVFLVKVLHKRRSEPGPQVVQVPLGHAEVPFNPRSQLLSAAPSASVSVPNSTFKSAKNSKLCILTLQANVPYRRNAKPGKKGPRRKDDTAEPEAQENGEESVDCSEDPPAKRRRLRGASPNAATGEGEGEEAEGEEAEGEEAEEQGQGEQQREKDVELVSYTAELIVFDNQKHVLLTDGDYELALQEKYKKPGRKRGLLTNRTAWEGLVDGQMGPFEVFAYGPTLKFKLSWAGTPVAPLNRRPTSHPVRTPAAETNDLRAGADESESNKEAKKKQRVFYQFIYNNHTRQQTEARDDFFCPWCSIDCHKLYSLLKHLKLCHGRFAFTYAPHTKGARIDVSVNERHDGSYAGRREDLNDLMGYAFSREGPCRRQPTNSSLVWRPHRRKESLSEFLQPDDDVDGGKSLYSGHNRQYFHADTSLAMKPEHASLMCDEQSNPDWMKSKTIQMIDDFTDVNSGEKELMKMWNIHMMDKGYIADFQVMKACGSFVEEHGRKIVENGLSRNFLIHLVNLQDFNLLSAGQILQVMNSLKELRNCPPAAAATKAAVDGVADE